MENMNEILEYIQEADDEELSSVIKAVIRRYKRVHPTQEVVFLSLPVDDPVERTRCIAGALSLLRKGDG